MKLARKPIAKTLSRFKSRRVFGIAGLCAVLVISLITRPAGAAVGYRSASSNNNGGGATSLTINTPAGAIIGDLLLASVENRTSAGGSYTSQCPGGWSQVQFSISNSNIAKITCYLYLSSAPASSYTFDFDDGVGAISVKASGGLIAYSGVDGASPIDTSAQLTNSASTSMTAPSVTTTVAGAMVVALYGAAAGGTVGSMMTAGSSMTERYDNASTGGGGGTRTGSGAQDILQPTATISGAKTMTSSVSAVSIGHTVALRPAPVISQVNYRFFQNTDSTTASTAYAAVGTPASISGSTPFRLRLNLGVASGGSSATNVAARTFTLQYALRGADNTCDASFTNETYANVTASTPVREYNNTTPVDGATYVTSANDPTRSGITAIAQKYEEINPLAVGTTALGDQDMLWDIALTTSGVSDGQTYCFRVLDNNNIVLNGGYTSMPEFTIPQPTVAQANHRWFQNADSATPGAPLVAQDTAASVPVETPVRLRQRLAVDIASLSTSNQNYKLQYAEKSGVCDPGFSGETYSDAYVSGSMYSVSNVGETRSAYEADHPIGWIPWTAPANGVGSDNSRAESVNLEPTVEDTEYLVVEANMPTIPSDATITGIRVGVEGQYQGDASAYGQIALDGVLKGTEQSISVSPFGNESLQYSGGSTSLWGATWTPAEINSATSFQVYLAGALWTGFGTPSLHIDDVFAEVYYTLPEAAPLAYFNNASPADNATISSTANDPSNGARPTVYQKYRETDPFTNSVAAIPSGSDGMWDFALTSDPSAAGKTYCLRVVKSNNALLDTYSYIPEISFTSPSSGPTLDQQLRGGQSMQNGVKTPLNW